MAAGIRDRVAIIGMGCTEFGERWDKGADDLMVDAFEDALADAGIDRKQIEAAWIGNALDDINVGNSALPLAHALRLQEIPVSRVENMCATGTEALRAATYAVASGAVDIALALGVEKLKDTGYGGLPLRTKGLANDLWMPYGSAPRHLCTARRRLYRAAWRRPRRPEARHGARVVEEPPERVDQPQGASAQADQH